MHRHIGFIPFYYLSSVVILSTPAAALPATSTDETPPPSHSFSPTKTRSLSSLSANYTHHHHFSTDETRTPFYATSAPSSGSSLPYHPSPFFSTPFNTTSGHNKKVTVIALAVIGGVIGLMFLALFTRQAIAYFRLPRHNGAMTTAQRDQLVREMAGYARSARHRSVPPPPPYERAPSYEESIG